MPDTPNLPAIVPSHWAVVLGQSGQSDDSKLPMPYRQEILLVECHVAGTSYCDPEALDALIEPGARLALQREPGNPADPRAIALRHPAGCHVGYVPRALNEALANLMDVGKLLVAVVEGKRWQSGWLKIDVRLYLRDL